VPLHLPVTADMARAQQGIRQVLQYFDDAGKDSPHKWSCTTTSAVQHLHSFSEQLEVLIVLPMFMQLLHMAATAGNVYMKMHACFSELSQ